MHLNAVCLPPNSDAAWSPCSPFSESPGKLASKRTTSNEGRSKKSNSFALSGTLARRKSLARISAARGKFAQARHFPKRRFKPRKPDSFGQHHLERPIL